MILFFVLFFELRGRRIMMMNGWRWCIGGQRTPACLTVLCLTEQRLLRVHEVCCVISR